MNDLKVKFREVAKAYLRKSPRLARLAYFVLKLFGSKLLSSKALLFCKASVALPLPRLFQKGNSSRRKLLMDPLNGQDINVRTIIALAWKEFESSMPDIFGMFAVHAKGLLDIGAHSGFYSLLGKYLNPNLKVFSFEPFPTAKQLLERNIKLNHFESEISVFNTALSESVGTAKLYIPNPTGDL